MVLARTPYDESEEEILRRAMAMSLEEEKHCFDTGSFNEEIMMRKKDPLKFRVNGFKVDEIAEEILKRDTAVRSDGTPEKDEKVMVLKKEQTGGFGSNK